MLISRPFRCEDCVHRYFSWLWAEPKLNGTATDRRSLVYQSSTAALHSAGHRPRGERRKIHANATGQAASSAPAAANSMQVFVTQKAVVTKAAPEWQTAKAKTDLFPEILGVILEMKHQAS